MGGAMEFALGCECEIGNRSFIGLLPGLERGG